MDNAITFLDVFRWAYNHLLELIVVLSIFIEFTPIKINPISWLSNILFAPLRKEMGDMEKRLNDNIVGVKDEIKEEMDQIKSEQHNQKDSIEELLKTNELSEISRIRWEIIEFSNSIENGQLHIRDEYRHIIDDNRRYHALIEKNGIENGFFEEEFEKISKHYEENKNSTSVYF